MRCRACNELLSDYESTLRSIVTRDYIGLCKVCLGSIKTDVLAVGNTSLMGDDDDDLGEGTETDLGLFDDYGHHDRNDY